MWRISSHSHISESIDLRLTRFEIQIFVDARSCLVLHYKSV